MDSSVLVNGKIEEGARLITALAEGGFDVSRACWLKSGDDETPWRLYIVTTEADRRSTAYAYQRIYEKLQEISGSEIEVADLKVLGTGRTTGKLLLGLSEEISRNGGLPAFSRVTQLRSIGFQDFQDFQEGYFYPTPERGSEGFSRLKRLFPSAKLMILRIPRSPDQPIDWFFRTVVPFVDKVNASEFEGMEPETAFCIGPRARNTDQHGEICFAHHPEGWNKMFRNDKQTWVEVVHINTGKKLYETADFSALSALVKSSEESSTLAG